MANPKASDVSDDDLASDEEIHLRQIIYNNLLKLKVSEHQVIELRTFRRDNGHVGIGFYDDIAALAREAARRDMSGQYSAIYFTLQEVQPDILLRSKNKLTSHARDIGTKDTEVQRYLYLPIDIDTVKPVTGIPASEVELEYARETAKQVVEYLRKNWNWNPHIVGFSGNGYNLLYRIDLPVNKVSPAWVKSVLQHLAENFTTDKVKIDQSVFNPARIWRLYGTTNRKGDEDPDGQRQHRRAAILSELDIGCTAFTPSNNPDALTWKQRFDDFAKTYNNKPKTQQQQHQTVPIDGSINESIDTLVAYLEQHKLHVREQKNNKIFLESCPFYDDHGNGTDTCVFFNDDNSIGFKCQHDRCSGKTWKDVRRKIDPTYVQSDPECHEKKRQHTVSLLTADASIETDNAGWRPHIISLSDVKSVPVQFLWQNRLVRGATNMLTGESGVGKGCVYMDLAARITTGRPLPVTGNAVSGSVIILSAEDDCVMTTESTALKPRLLAAGGDPCRVKFVNGKKQNGKVVPFSLDNDLSMLEQAIQMTPDVAMVVIDPITSYSGNVRDEEVPVRCFLRPIEELAYKYNVAILLVKHFKKGNAKAKDKVSGSTAWHAVPRCVLGISSKDDDESVKNLYVIKANWQKIPKTVEFRTVGVTINDDGQQCDTVGIEWGSENNLTANDFTDPSNNKLQVAIDALKEVLADGPQREETVRNSICQEYGISTSTLRRAKTMLHVESKKRGYGKAGHFEWSLPATTETTTDALTSTDNMDWSDTTTAPDEDEYDWEKDL